MCIHLVVFAILSCLEITAQTSDSVIDYKDISVNGVFLGSEKATFLEKFGRPDTTLRKTNEFQETPYYQYVYGESVFFVSNGRLDGFQILDSIYRLDNIDIKTGDPVSKLKTRFPAAFERQYRDKNMVVVKVRIGQTDSYILFHCDDKVIRGFSTWDDL